MSVYATTDPAIVARYEEFEGEHRLFAGRLENVALALDLPEGATWRIAGYGAVKFVVGIRVPGDTPPPGWQARELDGVLVPDLTTPQGREAAVIIGGLPNVPNARQCLVGTGMPTDVESVIDGKPRIVVPGVCFVDGTILVGWPTSVAIDLADDSPWTLVPE